MSAGSLGKWYLEFGLKGKEQLDAGIDGVEKKLKDADKKAAPIALGLGQKIATGVSAGIARIGDTGQKIAAAVSSGISKIGDTGQKLGASLAAGLGGVGKALAAPLLAAGAVVTAPFKAATAAAGGFAAGLLGPVAGAVKKLGEQLKAVGEAATVPFAVASAAVLGFVRAGLSGTTMGERLGLQFQLLSREIASLFIPIIERVIGAVQRVVDWFRSLSGAQQEAIGRAVTLGVGLLGVAAVLPRIIGGLQGIAAVFAVLKANPLVALVAGIAALLVGTEQGRSALGGLLEAVAPIGRALAGLGSALAPLISAIADALAPVVQALVPVFQTIASVIATVVGWITRAVEALGELLGVARTARGGVASGVNGGRGQNRHELANSSRGPESLAASFTRFQTAALRTGQGPEERIANASEQTNVILGGIAAGLGQPQPPPIE